MKSTVTQPFESSSSVTQATTSLEVEDDSVQLTGQGYLPVTNKLEIVNTLDFEKWPVYRILGKDGKLLGDSQVPADLDQAKITQMYESMVSVQAMDDIFYNAQRQGRISFYMQNSGEEGAHVGSAAALSSEDVVLAQYRELGVLLWRGFSLQQATDPMF